MNKILQLKDIYLTYHSNEGETNTLDNVTIDIYEGEFVAIVGPSGCGKSTLLSIISGLIKPTSGQITIDDMRPTVRNGLTGYMFQKDNLFEWRTIRSNINLGLQIKNIKGNNTYADELMEKYGLADFARHYPTQLSGGMRQRAALIRTLTLRPRLLLLDEPFSALDYQTRLELCDDIHAIIRSEKKTAILVTHDISEAISMSDRIILLSQRPAKIANIYQLDFDPELTPLQRRECSEFSTTFEKIWRDIQNEKTK